MFNPFNMALQPYFIFQAPSSTGSSFVFQQSPAFAYQQFFLQNVYQNGISSDDNAINQGQPAPEVVSSSNNAEDNGPESKNSKILMNKNIIKEKLIKKPANRPATYLTERKYYLAQSLQEESNQNRKLRPRNLNRRSQKSSDKSHPLAQNAIKMKEKNDLRRDDSGSSQIFESSDKKKIEYKSQEVSGNSLKTMELSASKEDSK